VTHIVRTTLRPDQDIEVGDAEAHLPEQKPDVCP